jgi:hypothetical protein
MPIKLKDSANQRHENYVDRLAAKLAKKMGPVHVQRPAKDDPVLQAANEVFQKAARRKVN